MAGMLLESEDLPLFLYLKYDNFTFSIKSVLLFQRLKYESTNVVYIVGMDIDCWSAKSQYNKFSFESLSKEYIVYGVSW